MWTLTGFADEVADDFAEQLELMGELQVRFIDLRSAWGRRVLDLPDTRIRLLKSMLDDAGIGVSSLATDLGKVPLDADFPAHLERARRAVDIAWFLETDDLRGFSFFPPAGAEPADHRAQVVDRLGQLVAITGDAGQRYLHENERGIYGDSPQRCAELVAQLDPHAFGLVFDAANFVQCRVQPLEEAYPLLRGMIDQLHVKDARVSDGEICLPGHGDVQWPALLGALAADGYDGFVSIEPHLASQGAFGGFSGPELWASAHRQLVDLLDAAGIAHA